MNSLFSYYFNPMHWQNFASFNTEDEHYCSKTFSFKLFKNFSLSFNVWFSK